jgi:hypothetical protein
LGRPAVRRHHEAVRGSRNAAHDAEIGAFGIIWSRIGQFYSSYPPMPTAISQTRAVTAESVTRSQKTTRMRARPKVLLATTYEEAMALYEQYEQNVLGVIVDAAFPREGRIDPAAGFRFARVLKERAPSLPVLMQSESQSRHGGLAGPALDKNSPTLPISALHAARSRFGDFVFRQPGGAVISRAPDPRTPSGPSSPLASTCSNVARSDFARGHGVRSSVARPSGRSSSSPTIQRTCGAALGALRPRALVRRCVVDYSARTFEGGSGVVRIGRSSLGGKGRGLAFLNALINRYQLERRFPDVRIFVPPTAVLTTGVFDRFMESSGLLSYALQESDDDRITEAFLDADLPSEATESLWNFLQWVRYPLAVRSSSLLEDASYQPFAGIYETYMIPNNAGNPGDAARRAVRCRQTGLCSTFHRTPRHTSVAAAPSGRGEDGGRDSAGGRPAPRPHLSRLRGRRRSLTLSDAGPEGGGRACPSRSGSGRPSSKAVAR